MSKFKKDLPIYALSASLVFLGIASASEAQAAWTAAEKKTVTQMQKQIGILSEQINSLEDQLGTVDETNKQEDRVEYLSDRPCGGSKSLSRSGSFTLGTARFYACTLVIEYTSE